VPVIRIITDIRTPENVSEEQIEEISKSAAQFANGTLVDLHLVEKNDAEVTPRTTHIHESGDYACEICKQLSRDEIH